MKHLDPKQMKKHDPRLFALGWQTYHPADIRLLRSKGYDQIKEIPSFYYLRSLEEDNTLFPAYMAYLQNNRLKPTLVARNDLFELLHYQ